MPNLNARVNRYLTPPETAFWNWSEEGDALVAVNGNGTIAFRAEIEAILRRHISQGLPPLGSVLLVVAACRDSWGDVRLRLKAKSTLMAMISEEFRLLDRIHDIPPELRTGTEAKAELSAMILEACSNRTSTEVAAAVVEALSSGLAVETVRREYPLPPKASRILADLRPLSEGLQRFDVDAFKLRFETGLEQLVAPAENAEEPLATRMRKLFNRLQSDDEFSGLVRLARYLLAMVHLPRPLVQPDELPVGGVSDIANRGTLDRLLLSELAQDDEMLMMRVAMNEAMYHRRETPPRNPPRTRLLLLDSGLRMWGLPRVMATSVAMSFAAMNDGPVDLRIVRGEGPLLFSADLSTREGLVEHLKVLDPHAHPGAALADLPRWLDKEAQDTDVILVTCESVLEDPEFQEWLDEFGEPIEFLATVSREGTFQLLQRTMHGVRLLRRARLDVEQLLAPTEKPVLPLINRDLPSDLPVILAVRPFPIRLSHNLVPQQTWRVRHQGVLAITNDYRLMHWDHPAWGARQITDQLPSRKLIWSQTRAEKGSTRFVIGNISQPKLHFGVMDFEQNHCELFPLQASPSHVFAVCEHAGVLLIVHREEIVVCDLATGERIHSMTTPKDFKWIHGRFFRRGSDWKALSYDGISPRFEDVKTETKAQFALFDVEGVQGPVGIATMDFIYLGLEAEGEFLPLPGSTLPMGILHISPDGTRVVTKQRRLADHSVETVLLDVLKRTVTPIYGDPYALLDPEIGRLARPRSYRNRIRAIGGHANGLLLQTPEMRCFTLEYDQNHSRFRIAPASVNRDRIQALRTFVPTLGPPGVNYQLQMAEWNDGSRAFLDSRGLLHLKSSDPTVSEATFVLTDGTVAGWCDNGTMWGDEYYVGRKSLLTQKEIRKNILSEFVARLR